jgi:hypothetical protein
MQILIETPFMMTSCSTEASVQEVADVDGLSHGGFSMDTESSSGHAAAAAAAAAAAGSSSSALHHHHHHHVQQHHSSAAHLLENVDQILAHELNKLSVQERVQALEDAHGVSGAVETDPETLTQKLKDLDTSISKRKTKLYELAESLSSTYVQNEDFRL